MTSTTTHTSLTSTKLWRGASNLRFWNSKRQQSSAGLLSETVEVVFTTTTSSGLRWRQLGREARLRKGCPLPLMTRLLLSVILRPSLKPQVLLVSVLVGYGLLLTQ